VVVVGDAACAFNPFYGQGMTAAAIGAEVLDRWLRGTSWRHGPGRGRVFQHSLARATAAAWQLSTGADYGFRTAEGTPQGRFAQWAGRYLARVMRAATRRPGVMRRLSGVFHLLHPPATLFGPGVLARLAWDRLAGGTGAGGMKSDLSARGQIVTAANATADLNVGSGSIGRGRSEPGDVPSSGDAMVERWRIRNVGRSA
jgi:hypothetical protein